MMNGLSKGDQANILAMRESLQEGLQSIKVGENWLEGYKVWKENDLNQFNSLLKTTNPFSLTSVGECYTFDFSSSDDTTDLDVIGMSVFLAEKLRQFTLQVFSDVKKERTRDNKIRHIKEYFDVIDEINRNKQLSGAIVLLNSLAEEQMVLRGSRLVDLYTCFFSLKENLRKSSAESLYLLFTYWRMTGSVIDLKRLTTSIIDYVQTYFYDYNNDPEMKLFEPLDGLLTIKKLIVIEHWLERIAFHTNGILSKYKNLKWICPTDSMADNIIETNQISGFEMMQYKRIFSSDNDKTVKQKAICNHSYAIWLKTVDVMYVVCDVFQVLNNSSDEKLKLMNTTKESMLEQYDNMMKIRNYYTGKVYFHQVYFELKRNYLNSQIMEALENDASIFSKSIGNVIDFVNAIASDDIDSMLQAKQNYLEDLKDYIVGNQEEELDDLTVQVVDKIKSTVQKLDAYDELYKAISQEFLKYESVLFLHPQIMSSLVSAEYLYQQYVKKRKPNGKFDYSCISIMYYMALEDFVNKLLYIPYSNDVLIKIPKENFSNEWIANTSGKYVSSFYHFWDRSKKLKKSCEIGVLGCLLSEISGEIFLKSYMTNIYKNIDIQRVAEYGNKLKKVAPRRNDAAHGGNYLSYNDVCIDKGNVYNTEVETYKGLILELMEICFG